MPETLLTELFPTPIKVLDELTQHYAARLSLTDVPEQIFTAPYYHHVTLLRAALDLCRRGQLKGPLFLNLETLNSLIGPGKKDVIFTHRRLALFLYYDLLDKFDIEKSASHVCCWGSRNIDNEQIQAEKRSALRGLTCVKDLATLIDSFETGARQADLTSEQSAILLATLIGEFLYNIVGLRGNWRKTLQEKIIRHGSDQAIQYLNLTQNLSLPAANLEYQARFDDTFCPDFTDITPVILKIDPQRIFTDDNLGGIFPFVISERPPENLLPVFKLKPEYVAEIGVVTENSHPKTKTVEKARKLLNALGYFAVEEYYMPSDLPHQQPPKDQCMKTRHLSKPESWTLKDFQAQTRANWMPHIRNGRIAFLADVPVITKRSNSSADSNQEIAILLGAEPFAHNQAVEVGNGRTFVKEALVTTSLNIIPGVFTENELSKASFPKFF